MVYLEEPPQLSARAPAVTGTKVPAMARNQNQRNAGSSVGGQRSDAVVGSGVVDLVEKVEVWFQSDSVGEFAIGNCVTVYREVKCVCVVPRNTRPPRPSKPDRFRGKITNYLFDTINWVN
jgi:hypothetical protein